MGVHNCRPQIVQLKIRSRACNKVTSDLDFRCSRHPIEPVSVPSWHLCKDVAAKVLRKAYAEDLQQSYSYSHPRDRDKIIIEPVFSSLQTADRVDPLICQVAEGTVAGIVSTLPIDEVHYVAFLDYTAGEWHSAFLSTGRWAVEVDIGIPVIIILDAAALEPVSLYPVYEVL